jgi:hypothetical protein
MEAKEDMGGLRRWSLGVEHTSHSEGLPECLYRGFMVPREKPGFPLKSTAGMTVYVMGKG